MRIKINDKIYRLKEIESGVDSLMELVEEQKYKNGDFVYEDERIMIAKSYPNMYHAIAWHTHSDRPNYNGTYAVNFSSPTFRYATEEERQILIDAMKKDGKRWNAEKKCIEDISVYKDGDFLHSDWNGENITIIYRKRNGNNFYYHANKSNSIGLCFDKGSSWSYAVNFRLATESEKKELIDALTGAGKRWNAEKKCIEDIPKRKFKAGDKVRIKDGISSKTHGNIKPIFTPGMDAYIGRKLTVKEYIGNGRVIFSEDIYGPIFDENWLEPWSDEPKVGDWVIAWDVNRKAANVGILEALGGEGEVFKYVVNGFKWMIAVKWNGTIEHLEKVRKGEL